MDSANVIVGYGYLYVAPYGTALPSLTIQPTNSTWTAAGFTEAGFTDDGVTMTEAAGVSTLTIGNPSNPDQGAIVLAFQGPAPTSLPGINTLGRVFVVYKAKATAAVSYHAQRKDKVVLSVKWQGIGVPGNALGNQVMEIIDYTGTGS